MKRRLWGTALTVTTMISLLCSCSSDGSDNNGQVDPIYTNPKEYVGKWTLTCMESINAVNDSTIYYNGDHIMVIKENGTAVDDINKFYYWRVDPTNNMFWRNLGTLWIGTMKTNNISNNEWKVTEQLSKNQFLKMTYNKIEEVISEDLVGKWNIYKVLKKSSNNIIDTLNSDWVEAGEDITFNDNWYDKYVTFKSDSTFIDYAGKEYEWLVIGPHIWTIGDKCNDMIRVYTGVEADRVSYVVYASGESRRFYLRKVEE